MKVGTAIILCVVVPWAVVEYSNYLAVRKGMELCRSLTYPVIYDRDMWRQLVVARRTGVDYKIRVDRKSGRPDGDPRFQHSVVMASRAGRDIASIEILNVRYVGLLS